MNKLFVVFVLLFAMAFSVSASNCDGVSDSGRSVVIVDNPHYTTFVVSDGVSHSVDNRNGSAVSIDGVVHQVSSTFLNSDSRLSLVTVDGDASELFVSGDGSWRSVDGGSSWSKFSDNDFSAICVSSDGSHVFVSGAIFMYSDNSGASFVRVDNPQYGSSQSWLGRAVRSPIHTGGHLLGISPDGRFVVVASTSFGTFGGWAWSSSDFGHSMNPIIFEKKFSGLFYSNSFKTIVLTDVGNYGYGDCVEQVGGMYISTDSGVNWHSSGLGARNWVNVSVSDSSIFVLSNPSSQSSIGFGGHCVTKLGSYELRPASMDTSIDGGVSWSSRTSLTPSEQSMLLTGRVIDIPNDGNVSSMKTIVLVGIAVVLVVLLLYLVFRPKKRR
jgi:hypothetical protein